MAVKNEDNPQNVGEDTSKDIFDLVGGDGSWQRRLFLLALLLSIPSAGQILSMSFLAPNQDHWCSRPSGSNWTVERWKELAMADEAKHCYRHKNYNATPSLEAVTSAGSNQTKYCDSWEYDTSFYTSTVITQWNLVCNREWLVSFSKSAVMAGTILANIFVGYSGDKLGRRPTIFITGAFLVVSSCICALSISVEMFIVGRFFLAIGITGIYDVPFILMMELVAPKHRSLYGIAFNFGWGIGFVTLPGVAWLLRDWFWIQIALTVPYVMLIATWWLCPESPRWLMSQGKVDEAKEILVKIARTNDKDMSRVSIELKKMFSKASEVHKSGETKGSYFDLLRTDGLWQMTLNIYVLWFVNALVYYGLSYNTNELAGDPFVNFALSGAVEFPAYVVTPFVIGKFGRKYPLACAMIVCGISCMIMYPLPADPWWLVVIVSMIGKFLITCSFTITYLMTSELFPTVLRNIGLGSSSAIARLGSILSPFARELGYATHPVVPQLVFGVLALMAGASVFWLPETNNTRVPETVADAASRNKRKHTKSRVKSTPNEVYSFTISTTDGPKTVNTLNKHKHGEMVEKERF